MHFEACTTFSNVDIQTSMQLRNDSLNMNITPKTVSKCHQRCDDGDPQSSAASNLKKIQTKHDSFVSNFKLCCILYAYFFLLFLYWTKQSLLFDVIIYLFMCVCVSDSHFFSNLESEKYNVSNGLFSLFKSSKTIWNIEEKKDQIFSVRNTHMAAMKYIQIIKIRIEYDCAKTSKDTLLQCYCECAFEYRTTLPHNTRSRRNWINLNIIFYFMKMFFFFVQCVGWNKRLIYSHLMYIRK